jgi:pimeloyl-ACP methyl ester carboxylesterase
MDVERHNIVTADGWHLAARRVLLPGGHGPQPAPGPPLVIVPGYGMNSFIFGFHPTGRSFMQALAEGGLDTWTVDLRGQGGSSYQGRRCPWAPRWGLAEHAFMDLPAVFEHICRVTGHRRLDAVGCSLGGGLVYAYAARYGGGRLHRVVAMGAPLVMTGLPPLARAAGYLGPPLGLLPMRGIRPLARYALPVLSRYARPLLDIYLNAELTDTSDPSTLSRTVEDPRRRINRELARWIRRRRLVLDGLDVAEGLRGLTLPTLVVVAMGDGIVNPPTCRSVIPFLGAGQVDELVVGGPDLHVAHADLFISRIADERVFGPIVSWLNP